MDINKILEEYDSMFGNCELADIEAFLQQNIERAHQEGDFGVVITLLNEIIGFCRDTTQREKALSYCDELLAVMDEIKLQGRVEYATSLLNIANAYRAFGLCEESVALYEQVHENYKVNVKPESFDYASLYNNWSLVYQELGEFEQARELLMKALEVVDLYEEAVIPQANTRTNLATTLLQLHTEQAYEEAMKYLSEALEIYERGGGVDFHYGAALVAMGDAHVSKQQYEQAASYYQRGMGEIEKHVGRTENYKRVEEKYIFCVKCLQKAKTVADFDGKQECIDEKKRKREVQVQNKENISEEKLQKEPNEWISNLERCRTFYQQYGKPMIEERFSEYADRIAVGLVGEGSDCFGFDDHISTDHDYEVGFCMWLTQEDYAAIGADLQAAYEELFVQRNRLLNASDDNDSDGALAEKETDTSSHYANNKNRFIDNRRGVFSINEFCNHLLGTHADFEENDFGKKGQIDYLTIEEYRFAMLVNGEVFRDDLGIFTTIRKQVQGYYPEEVWRMRLSKALHDFSQYAQSNYPRMMARQDLVTAHVCVGKAIESVLDIGHLLNHTYAPYYKWKSKSMEGLLKLQGVLPMLDALTMLPNQRNAWEQVKYDATVVNTKDEAVVLFEQIAEQILQEMNNQALIEGDDTFLELYCSQIIKGKNMDIIEQIVELEWNQFDKVKNEGGRADCQDDFATFSVMRKSQYMTWNRELLTSYYNDLLVANQKGWNLIMEKYARMMKSTAPTQYAELEKDLPVLNEKRIAIQEEIIKIQVNWMEEFASKYPKMADNARSIHTEEDNAYNTSYETYLRGELGTYSENTFVLYGRFITTLMQGGKNLAYETMSNTAKLYGYQSVEDAEKRMW
ncbi:MAG: DUF4125 family protein [Lachnospiraceae bacterium]|nr:DUF4125 family protein [Lachnospiraceae bacterium]